MIALDTNVLVRYLVRDDVEQAAAARSLLESLTVNRPGYVCREVTVEIVWVLERAYGYSRDQIATILEELVATEELIIEAADDVGRAVSSYRMGGAGFSDLMILAAAERVGAHSLYTFDQKAARLEGATLVIDKADPIPEEELPDPKEKPDAPRPSSEGDESPASTDTDEKKIA